MADLLRTGATWLEEQRHAHMTSSVTYSRGVHSVVLLATVGRTPFEVQDASGALVQYEARDYLIRVGDLILDSALVIPAPGDRITEVIAAISYRYDVMAPGGEPCWRYSDQFQQTFRIHTKSMTPLTPHA